MIRVMSFNIRCSSAEDGANNWEFRKELVVERIHAFHPDLIGMQECRNDGQAEFIQASLPEYEFLGVPRGGEGDTAVEMAPLLFRGDRFEAIESGVFWLSKTPEITGSKDWGSAFPRTVTWARLRDRKQPAVGLAFANTHFDYIHEEVMTESARVLRRWIDGLGNLPVILTGDFNCLRDSRAHTILAGEGAGALIDPWERLHPKEQDGTFHGFGAFPEGAGIDWILASGVFEAISAEIDRTRAGEVYPSDHDPLCVVVRAASPG